MDGISLLLGGGILLIRGQVFRDAANVIYGGVLVLLVAVLLFGKEVNGAKAWFAIGGFGIQPAEFAEVRYRTRTFSLPQRPQGLGGPALTRDQRHPHPDPGGTYHATARYRDRAGLRCVHPGPLP